MLLAALALIWGFRFLLAHHPSASLPLGANITEDFFEPEFQPIRKRVRPASLHADRVYKRQRLLGDLDSSSKPLQEAIDTGDIDKLRTGLAISTSTISDLTKLLLYACDTEKFACVEVLVADARADITARSNFLFLRALQLRQFTLLGTLLAKKRITCQPYLMKEAIINLWKLFFKPPTEEIRRKKALVVTLLQKISSSHDIVDVLSRLKIQGREYVEERLMKVGLLNFDQGIPPPEPASIGPYLTSRFQTDDERQAWLFTYYGQQELYEKVLCFLPRSLLLSISTQIDTKRLNASAQTFLSLVAHEDDSADTFINVEERFWANCLLDNYSHLLGDMELQYEGSVTADEEQVTRFFPRYNHIFLEHFKKICPMITGSPEELAKLHRLLRLVGNVAESGRRYDNSAAIEQLQKRLEAMEPGEEYGLDVYALDGPADPIGHLVLAIVTRRGRTADGEPLFDMRMINTGSCAFEACGLEGRTALFVDQFLVPLGQLMERYGNVIRGPSLWSIYLPEHIPELHMGIYDRNGTDMFQFIEVENPACSPPAYQLEQIGCGQRWGSCSLKRLWALAKIILGIDLYMEFKMQFVMSFVGEVSMNFQRIVGDRWKSPRASTWFAICQSLLLEHNLLRQLNRLDPKSERHIRLRKQILAFINRGTGMPA